MPYIMPSNVTTPLAQISDLPLQRGGTRLQNSAVNPPPPILALLLQQDVLPLQASAFRCACFCHSSSILYLDSRESLNPPSTFRCTGSCSSTFNLSPSACQDFSSVFSRKSSSSSSALSLSSSTRLASSSASIRVCSSSSTLHIASRARKNPYSNFNHAHLCSSAFCLASLESYAGDLI